MLAAFRHSNGVEIGAKGVSLPKAALFVDIGSIAVER
jgi:hypothetical protein